MNSLRRTISCGLNHFLTIDEEGNVWAVGRNDSGQCGRANSKLESLYLTPLSKIVSLDCGQHHSLCVHENGSVWSFGKNNYRQLGRVVGNNKLPVILNSLKHIRNVHCGVNYSICIDNENFAWGFGCNKKGQLGIGSCIPSYINTPTKSIIEDVEQVSCGFAHSLFLKCNGEVWAVGAHGLGELGLGLTDTDTIDTPILNQFLENIVSISCGFEHSIVLDANGDVFVFGSNLNRQLGCGEDTMYFEPEKIELNSITKIKAISATHQGSVLLDDQGYVWTCGFTSPKFGRLNVENISVISKSCGNFVILQSVSDLWLFGNNDIEIKCSDFNNEIPVKLDKKYSNISCIPIAYKAKSARK